MRFSRQVSLSSPKQFSCWMDRHTRCADGPEYPVNRSGFTSRFTYAALLTTSSAVSSGSNSAP
jgi:hypothetical protein